MKLENLQNKLVAVLGYGMEGRATAKYLLKHGIKPVLFDQRPWAEWPAEEQEQIKSLGVNFIFGPDCFKELAGFEVAFRSPGVRLSQLTINNLQLTSQTKWFFENCPAKIIGVTGTKGKGTTCALVYEMLRKDTSYKVRGTSATTPPSSTSNLAPSIYLTGNIGKVQPFDILDNLKAGDWVVYELSSFQLQDLNVSPHIAVVLMVTSEHLDYHKDNKEYINAKSSITKFQTANDFAVINADFENSMTLGKLGEAKKLYFSSAKSRGIDCWAKDGSIAIKDSDFRLPTSHLQLKGAHNLENICAAVLAARIVGAADEQIAKAARDFTGLEHRLEFVTEKNGIKFYNDSFSTTPETAIAAITAFTEPLVLILGGQTKHSDFSGLGKRVAASKNIRVVILIGAEKLKIKQAIEVFGKNANLVLSEAKNMPEIFAEIKRVAQKGDLVLLSPACASFDMFDNYKQRGELFKAEAEKWQ